MESDNGGVGGGWKLASPSGVVGRAQQITNWIYDGRLWFVIDAGSSREQLGRAKAEPLPPCHFVFQVVNPLRGAWHDHRWHGGERSYVTCVFNVNKCKCQASVGKIVVGVGLAEINLAKLLGSLVVWREAVRSCLLDFKWCDNVGMYMTG